MAGTVDCGAYTILSLTASTEESLLTRNMASFLLPLSRLPAPAASLLSFDILADKPSTFGPGDPLALRALSLIFVRLLIRRGLLYHKPSPSGHFQIHLSPLAEPVDADIIQSAVVRPASFRTGIFAFLRKGSCFTRTGTGDDAEPLSLAVTVCPVCSRVLKIGKSCPRHPHVKPHLHVTLLVSKPVQRLIWLACSLTIPSSKPAVSTLICEPRLSTSHLGLFFSFILQLGHRLPFKEILVWPRQPFKGSRDKGTIPVLPPETDLISLWPGWKAITCPPTGRIRFVQKLYRSWGDLRQINHSRPVIPDQGPETSNCSSQIDRWLLHSLNLMVAAFLNDEEQRRSALALEKMARFIRKALISDYLVWRKTDWDQSARDILATVMNVLSELAMPYNLRFSPPPDKRTSSFSLRLYRRDWIFTSEYKLLTTVRDIIRMVRSLRGEIKRAGFTPDDPVFINSPQLRSLPRDLGRLLKRILPQVEMEFTAEKQMRDIFGLRTQTGSWRILQAVVTPDFREQLVQYYREQLQKDQTAYETIRGQYEDSKRKGRSQNSLKSMRRKLLTLKKRQMISLSRVHELQ